MQSDYASPVIEALVPGVASEVVGCQQGSSCPTLNQHHSRYHTIAMHWPIFLLTTLDYISLFVQLAGSKRLQQRAAAWQAEVVRWVWVNFCQLFKIQG